MNRELSKFSFCCDLNVFNIDDRLCCIRSSAN